MITQINPPRRDREGMSLRTAQRIARKLGVTIVKVAVFPEGTHAYRVNFKLGRERFEFWGSTPQEAAKIATLESAKAASAFINLAKQIFVEENLIFADFEV